MRNPIANSDIFSYHCTPKLEVTTSGGVDRTTLSLDFEGHQPDIAAMKQLYDNPDELIEVSIGQENMEDKLDVPQNVPQTEVNVPQSAKNVPQNVSAKIKVEIIKLVSESPNITRQLIAKKLEISSKTVGRHLSKLGISWEGHPKTGHWVMPQKNRT